MLSNLNAEASTPIMRLENVVDPQRVPSYTVLGCRVHAVTALGLTDLVDQSVSAKDSVIIANHNLHSLYLYEQDHRLRSFFAQATWIHADGMGVLLLAWLGGTKVSRSSRVTYVDWLPLLLKRATIAKWRVFYLGSRPGVAEKGKALLEQRYPGLILDVANGYFDMRGSENEIILDKIHSFSPDLLMVGMGMPRQERWILDNISNLGSLVVLPCGASMDYVAGAIPTPPRWAGLWGIEWLYRLVAEPRRLWRRYLFEPWHLSFLMFCTWRRSRKQHSA
jgi:N-acetylglucosaminyldiphosphoundecaprenol N-acetyl-beta-D-mannosaminyltransferase